MVIQRDNRDFVFLQGVQARISTAFMRKNLLTFGTALLLLSGAIFTDAASAAGMVSLGGHVPSLISHLTAKGLLPGTNQLNLAIGLHG